MQQAPMPSVKTVSVASQDLETTDPFRVVIVRVLFLVALVEPKFLVAGFRRDR